MESPQDNRAPDGERFWHQRLHRFSSVDEIRIKLETRFKASGMSGDEWRTHASVELLFKGEIVNVVGFRDIETAVLGLGGVLNKYRDLGIPHEVIESEKRKCDQPSCTKDATALLVLKRRTSPQGDYLDPTGDTCRYYRQFCEEHERRGDCSLEDNDANYDRLPITPAAPVAPAGGDR